MSFFKDIKYAVVALIVMSCEMTFGKYISVFGAVPMLTFCLCIIVSMLEDDYSYVVVYSLILGAAADFISGHGFGTYTVAFAFSVYITYRFKDTVFSSQFFFLALDVFCLTILVQFFYMIVHIGDIGTGYFFKKITSVVLPTALYNTVICLVFYSICAKLSSGRR